MKKKLLSLIFVCALLTIGNTASADAPLSVNSDSTTSYSIETENIKEIIVETQNYSETTYSTYNGIEEQVQNSINSGQTQNDLNQSESQEEAPENIETNTPHGTGDGEITAGAEESSECDPDSPMCTEENIDNDDYDTDPTQDSNPNSQDQNNQNPADTNNEILTTGEETGGEPVEIEKPEKGDIDWNPDDVDKDKEESMGKNLDLSELVAESLDQGPARIEINSAEEEITNPDTWATDVKDDYDQIQKEYQDCLNDTRLCESDPDCVTETVEYCRGEKDRKLYNHSAEERDKQTNDNNDK